MSERINFLRLVRELGLNRNVEGINAVEESITVVLSTGVWDITVTARKVSELKKNFLMEVSEE